MDAHKAQWCQKAVQEWRKSQGMRGIVCKCRTQWWAKGKMDGFLITVHGSYLFCSFKLFSCFCYAIIFIMNLSWNVSAGLTLRHSLVRWAFTVGSRTHNILKESWETSQWTPRVVANWVIPWEKSEAQTPTPTTLRKRARFAAHGERVST